MILKSRLFKFVLMGMVIVSFPSCNGIFEGLYDEPELEQKSEFGFIKVDKTQNTGTVYVDASSYKKWVYIDFHTLSIDSMEIKDEMQEPDIWDLAIHRYNAKTNGATVLETEFTTIDELLKSGKVPEGNYMPDVEGKVTVDMSGMMEGNIIYAKSNVNKELAKWLNIDFSTMPPVYTLSNKVYVVKLPDNTYLGLRLVNFMNKFSEKGFLTIDYVYPLLF